jgi:hypothetical protein
VSGQENQQHKTEELPISESQKAAQTAETSVRRDLESAYRMPGEKPATKTESNAADDKQSKSFTEMAADEAYALLKAAGSWLKNGDKSQSAVADQDEMDHGSKFLDCSNPFKKSDSSSTSEKTSNQGKSEAPEEKSWFGRARDWVAGSVNSVRSYFEDRADFLANGYTKGTDVLSDSWTTALKSNDLKDDIKLMGKMNAGETKAVFLTSNHDSRMLTEDEVRYKDKDGNTIISNRKTHETIAQSADGKTVYMKKPDGTEIIKDESGQITRNKKEGTYTKIDNDGTVTKLELDKRDPEHQKVITELDKGFSIIQTRMRFSWKEAHGNSGDNIMFRDGIAHIHDHGTKSVVLNDGTTHVKNDRVGEIRVKNGKLEQEQPDGSYKEIKEGDPIMKHIRQRENGGWEIMGVNVDREGTVTTDSGQCVRRKHDGVCVSGKDRHGRDVEGTVQENGNSEVVDGKGTKTILNVDRPDHLVERIDADGHKQFTYDDDKDTLCIDDEVTFGPDDTWLDFADVSIDDDGSISFEDDSYLIDNSEEAYQDAHETAHGAVSAADSIGAAVAGEISRGTCDFGDVDTLIGAIGNLNDALGVALAAGNLDAAGKIIMKKAELEGMLGDVRVRAQVAAELGRAGITDPSSVNQAQQKLGTNTITEIVNDEQERQK